MKNLLLSVMILFSNASYGQQDQNNFLMNENVNLNLFELQVKDSNVTETDLDFGIDAGYSFGSEGNSYLLAGINIEVMNKKWFARIEFGEFFDRNFSNFNYTSLGLDYRILNSGKSKLDYNFGIALGWEKLLSEMGVGTTMGAKYFYSVTNRFGVTGSIKIPFITKEIYPFFGIGIQVK